MGRGDGGTKETTGRKSMQVKTHTETGGKVPFLLLGSQIIRVGTEGHLQAQIRKRKVDSPQPKSKGLWRAGSRSEGEKGFQGGGRG